MKSFEQWLQENNLIEAEINQIDQDDELNESLLDKSEPSPAYYIRQIKNKIREIDEMLKRKKYTSPVAKKTEDGGKTISRSHFPTKEAKTLLASLGRGFFGMGPKAFKLDQQGRALYQDLKAKEKELREKLGENRPTSENASFAHYISFRERTAA
jgi:hypothetical protein